MPHDRAVRRSIACAESILPGRPAPDGEPDPRWLAIMQVGNFIGSHPEAVWEFAFKWAKHPQGDLQSAVACCLVEHLLQYHFDVLFPRMHQAADTSVRFASILEGLWLYGQAELPQNAARMKMLQKRLRKRRLANRRAA